MSQASDCDAEEEFKITSPDTVHSTCMYKYDTLAPLQCILRFAAVQSFKIYSDLIYSANG